MTEIEVGQYVKYIRKGRGTVYIIEGVWACGTVWMRLLTSGRTCYGEARRLMVTRKPEWLP